jgi:hypothetical protein
MTDDVFAELQRRAVAERKARAAYERQPALVAGIGGDPVVNLDESLRVAWVEASEAWNWLANEHAHAMLAEIGRLRAALEAEKERFAKVCEGEAERLTGLSGYGYGYEAIGMRATASCLRDIAKTVRTGKTSCGAA